MIYSFKIDFSFEEIILFFFEKLQAKSIILYEPNTPIRDCLQMIRDLYKHMNPKIYSVSSSNKLEELKRNVREFGRDCSSCTSLFVDSGIYSLIKKDLIFEELNWVLCLDNTISLPNPLPDGTKAILREASHFDKSWRIKKKIVQPALQQRIEV